MKTVLGCKLEQMRNGEHYSYHYFVLETIPDKTANLLGITVARNEYAAMFNIEDESMIAETGSLDTKTVSEKDKERDHLFLYISGTVRLQISSPEKDIAVAAETLSFLLKGYKNLATRSYSDESAMIINLVQDITKQPYAEAVSKLGLAAQFKELGRLNDEFIKLYNVRNAQTAAKSNIENVIVARRNVDKAYRTITTMLNSLYVVYSSVDNLKSDDMATTIGEIIDLLNARIEKENNSIAIRSGRNVSQESETEQQEQPSEEKENVSTDN